MRPLIIFEGIASGGKTTLERMTQERLEGSVIVSEERTLMPIIENRVPQKAIEHLFGVLDDIETQAAKVFIVDRFHITHAFRTGAPLSAFREVEDRLREQHAPRVVLLRMDESAISDRIKETAALRGSSWAKGKQGSLDEKVAYYTDQQRTLVILAKQSSLPVLVIDTTDKNWSRAMSEIGIGEI